MNHLEQMKTALIAQISKMDVKEFYAFTNVLEEENYNHPGCITSDALFPCDRCREVYKDCEEPENKAEMCFTRYKDYALK